MKKDAFEPVSPKHHFAREEKRWLSRWEQDRVFQRSVEQRKDGPTFTFYEGPPTANGMPHAGHVLTRIMKDVFLRYRSMCGFHVPRRAGWDTHGLPVEVEVEKELGIHGRQAITEFGVEAFTRRCIDSVFRYIDAWQEMTERIGFWVDLSTAYVTFHSSYVQSVWWALKQLFDQGLLYQGHKIVWWWPQGGTALSAGEVGQGYKTVDDPSVIVRFAVQGETNTSFLAWTTTPWTLPSNVALAVHPEATYLRVRLKDETVIVAEERREAVLLDQGDVLSRVRGSDLVNMRYDPPFHYKKPEGGDAHRVVEADFVTMDTGSGLVHMAPAFGEDDFRVSKEKGLGFLQLVDPGGRFVDEVTDFRGRFCKEADRDIIRHLKSRGLLFSETQYRHEYPFCWRAMDDPLIQYARRSWFIRTTERIDHMIENNQAVRWEPAHIKDGRFGSFLDNNVDWALSRERFWGTPLPIWVNDQTGDVRAVSSVEEIERKNPKAFDAFRAAQERDPSLPDDLMVHRPWIDEVTWTEAGVPGEFRRVPEVIDCWFDSGCMPFAQHGYPHKNKDDFATEYPADFITEAVDQTRGWFYSLLAVNTLLFPDRPAPHPYRNCTVLGFITDEKGQKFSKHKKNYTDPMEVMNQQGADAVRWAFYTNCVPGQNTRFYPGAAQEALRDFLIKTWNVYSFLVTYARIDGWYPREGATVPVHDRPDLDRWILSMLHTTIDSVRRELDNFRSHTAARTLNEFNEHLSNWYVRRSRGRFWAEGDTKDKLAAFETLHEVLLTWSSLLAPFVPFIAETMYQNLCPAPLRSVHLSDYPKADTTLMDRGLEDTMDAVMTLVSLGKRVRSEQKIKVRQPLSRAIAVVGTPELRMAIEPFEDTIKQELNVHGLEFAQDPHQHVHLTLLPNFRRLGPKLGKDMPKCNAALQAMDAQEAETNLRRTGTLTVRWPGGEVELDPDDVTVRLQARDGYAAAAQGEQVLIVDTTLDEALIHEGIAREVINRIQRERKDQDLPFETRIHVQYHSGPEVHRAIDRHLEHIKKETLSTHFEACEQSLASSADIEGTEFRFTVKAM